MDLAPGEDPSGSDQGTGVARANDAVLLGKEADLSWRLGGEGRSRGGTRITPARKSLRPCSLTSRERQAAKPDLQDRRF